MSSGFLPVSRSSSSRAMTPASSASRRRVSGPSRAARATRLESTLVRAAWRRTSACAASTLRWPRRHDASASSTRPRDSLIERCTSAVKISCKRDAMLPPSAIYVPSISPALERGPPLLEVRADPLARVGRGEELLLELALERQAAVEIDLAAGLHRALDGADRARR